MNSKLILSVFLALACAVVSAKEDCTELAEWKEFKSKFNKHYASVAEENRRCQLWYEIYNDVHQHNADKTQTYTKAVYHFADWTPEEHKQFRFGYKHMGHPFRDMAERKELPVVSLPASVDWKAKGAVTPIKNQGSCGSCWTFSVIGVMEGAYKIAKGSLFSFSEQQLVDCNTAYPQGGCNGGLPAYALKYVNTTGGLQLQSDYPYKGVKQSTCSYKAATAKKVKIKSIVNLDDRDSQIQTALANVGPLSVCVCASPMSFSMYYSGIYNGVTCTPAGSDHAVLAVGYVKNSTTCYYVIKNSWGTSWGLNGYMNIACNTVSKNQTVDIYYPVLA